MKRANGDCLGSMVSVRGGEQRTMRVEYDDGGAPIHRANRNDCVARAFAIASGTPYMEVVALIRGFAKRERVTATKGRSNAMVGVYKYTTRKVAEALGFSWTPTMGIGTGCTVHVDPWELPETGRHILNLSRHVCAYIDGVVHDTGNPSRDGTRCVYGYWSSQ